jgi:hypothetical protein
MSEGVVCAIHQWRRQPTTQQCKSDGGDSDAFLASKHSSAGIKLVSTH